MTPQRPQIYLHIGPPKTATTFLQDIIWGNRAALADQGVHLVGKNGLQHFLASMDLREQPLGGFPDPRIPGTWDALVEAALQVKTGKALISHEIFAGCRGKHIARLAADLSDADVHIIYTARDLGRQIPAVWQEGLKNRSTMTFDRFLDESLDPDKAQRKPAHFWLSQDSVAVLKRWSVASTPERVHLLTAPPSGAPSTLVWDRFASILDIDTSRLDMTVARSNTSLSHAEAEVLRLVNGSLPEDFPFDWYHRLIKKRFNHLANLQPRGERIRIPERYRDVILEESARIQKGLADAGYELTGDLNELEVPDSVFGSNDPIAPELVTEAATNILAFVLTRPWARAQAEKAETRKQRMRRQVIEFYWRTRGKVGRLVRRFR